LCFALDFAAAIALNYALKTLLDLPMGGTLRYAPSRGITISRANGQDPVSNDLRAG